MDKNQKTIFLYPGDLCVSESPVLYKTVLGSCISVCLFDTKLKRGAMNHFMHPESTNNILGNKCGDISMHKLIRGMLDKGSSIGDLRASVFGGASGNRTNRQDSPGEKNRKVALKILKEYRIPVIREETGGCYGRNVSFHTSTNEISFEQHDSCLRYCRLVTCDQAVKS